MNLAPIFASGRRSALPSWPRLGAAMIDFLVLLIPEIILFELIAAPAMSKALTYYNSHPAKGLSSAVARSPGYESSLYHFYIAIEAVTAAYLILCYLRWGATVGKLVLGLRITSNDGSPLGPRDAVLRSVPFWLPLLVPSVFGVYLFIVQYIGSSILIMVRPDHRGIEDMLGRSIVVHKDYKGKSLGELLAVRPLVRPPLEPPAPRPDGGGHLPGWEPVHRPPEPADQDDDREGQDQED